MKAIILAAGRGSRMLSLTDNNPKGLVRLNGRSLINYQISALQVSGIRNIGVVTGYQADKYQFLEATKFHNTNWEQTNMVASLLCASDWLNNDECIISYSDIVYNSDDVKSLIRKKADIAITYDPNWLNLWSKRFPDPLVDCETFDYDENRRLIAIGDKPKDVASVKGQYTGLFKISPNGWTKILHLLSAQEEYSINKLDVTKLLSMLLENNIEINCVPLQHNWLEVDSEEDLNLYEKWIAADRINFV